MNKITFFFILCLFTFTAFSQGGTESDPISWNLNLNQNPTPIELPPLDFGMVSRQDSINDLDKTVPWRYGIERTIAINTQQNGMWNSLSNGGKLWRVAIKSPRALNLSVNFNNFFLPKGSRLQLYNQDHTDITNTFTSLQNRDNNGLGTWFVEGNVVWIEYYQPPRVQGSPHLEISSIIHGYRMGAVNNLVENTRGLNDSGDCNYDVNCPVGADFDQKKDIVKKAVAMLNLGNGYLCSAALVNNTSQDKTPFLLTANHCLENSDPSLWSIRFNWVSPNPVCGTGDDSGDIQTNFTMSGAELKAKNNLSDFVLVKLYENIPESWDVVFAGWDNSDIDPLFEVGIHHPNGDIMKISRDDSGAKKIDANGTQVWLIGGGSHGTGNGWEIGTTESGSSGSPLFDNHGRIIGQLYAGEAACNGFINNHDYDIYGRFGVSWNAGSTPQTRLMDWLDPHNTEQTTMETLQNILNVQNFELIGDLKIYPNPAKTSITVMNNRYPRLIYQFNNVLGQQISAGSLSNTMNIISVENFSEGIYFLHLIDEDSKDSITKKIIVER